MKRRPALFSILFAVSLLVATAARSADTPPTPGPAVTVATALQLGPLPLPLPAFADSPKQGVTLDDMLASPSLNVATLRPHEGDEVPLPHGQSARWQAAQADAGGFTISPTPGAAAEAYLAFYAAADRYQKVTLEVPVSEHVMLTGWLDGVSIELKKVNGDLGQPLYKGDLTLTMGNHVVVLRTLSGKERTDAWLLAPRCVLPSDLPATALTCSVSARRTADIHLVLDTPRTTAAHVSPDGTLVAVELSDITPAGERETWLSIRRTQDGTSVATWRGDMKTGGVAWAPDGERLSYTSQNDDRTDLWLYDLKTAHTERLLRGIEHMGQYRWSPDGSFVIYEVQVEAKPDARRVKHVENPADRQSSWRNRDYLVMVTVPDGVSRRLTAGPLSPASWSISPDSRRVLFLLQDQDLTARPYFSTEVWELDLTTFQAEMVLDDPWVDQVAYAPDDRSTLLVRGSPSAFDGLGRNLPAGVQANDYGGQLYLYDRASKQATPISRDLVPDVGHCWWSRADGMIYALCTDRQYQRVYRRKPKDGAWQLVETGIDFVDDFDLAETAARAVARGSSATTPDHLFAVDLKRNQSALLLDPGRAAWHDVAFGKVEVWAAPMPDGSTLDGRIYFPPDFDAKKTYPVIVYYYGGTLPVTVDFGGRYPKNVWAGQGYVVYVPEPSGATGYGQEFAARHVNDWGKRTAREVIDATQAFLSAHPWADAKHVGCIGASYGGFLTEYLVTQTDIFACAISHAGISDITSYWGVGWWGYDYGSRALANAFPWHDRDIYVGQSPVYHADRIHTPLLLLHGTSDTNVPVGESDQLFTALKLLGRDVDYVQIVGQNHWILDHGQRIVWNDTILAYFARYLKDRPAWWQAMYPD